VFESILGERVSTKPVITINARDGGTDANDWAEMLLRMYTLWAQKNDYDVVLLERQDNIVAGIQSATIAIRGPMAYGYLKGETGMHRLVRISPFNAEAKRQTSFAAIDVSPEINDSFEVDLRDEDIPGSGFASLPIRRIARTNSIEAIRQE
jgi:peptide chain release factor 2